MENGDPIKLNFEDLEMQKQNIPPDRVQRVDEKNVVSKMPKMAHFFVFCADDSKKFRQNI